MKLSDCGHNSIVQVGNHYYRLYRLEVFESGLLGTMKLFPRLQECNKVNPSNGLPSECWWDNYKVPPILKDWSDECFLIDDSMVKVSGDKV